MSQAFSSPFFPVHYSLSSYHSKLYTKSLTPRSGVLLGKLTVPHLVKIFQLLWILTDYCRIENTVSLFVILSQINPVSAPYSTTLRFIPLLPCHVNPVLPRGHFLEVSALKPCMYLFLPTHCELLTDSLSKPYI
jgi:hypothetical protein